MKLEELQVDVGRLYDRSLHAGWGWKAVTMLWEMACLPVPSDHKEWRNLPMSSVGYLELAPHLDGYMRLAAVDSLLGVDGVKTGGAVLLAMANRVFLPHVPQAHRARRPTEALLAALAGYLFDGEAAEPYIREAFLYRSAFGTSCTAIGSDPAYEQLFEAMPAEGLDCALGEGHWDLSGHWRSFGRFLAGQGADWAALRALEVNARTTEFVGDDEDSDAEAHDALNALLDDQRDRYIEAALQPYDEELRELVDGLLATVCAVPAKQASDCMGAAMSNEKFERMSAEQKLDLARDIVCLIEERFPYACWDGQADALVMATQAVTSVQFARTVLFGSAQ